MLNKLLVTFIFPTYETKYDIYIPINKKIGTIKQYVLATTVGTNNTMRFIEKSTGQEYNNDILVRDSDIKNGTEIIVM